MTMKISNLLLSPCEALYKISIAKPWTIAFSLMTPCFVALITESLLFLIVGLGITFLFWAATCVGCLLRELGL